MYFTGCDAHKNNCTLQHIDEDGALGLMMTIPNSKQGFNSFLDKLDAPTVITLEASRGYWWQHQYLSQHPKVARVVVVDPYRSEKITKELAVEKGYGRASNDRIDSEMLAELTRKGLAVGIQVPTPEQFELRTACRHRLELTHNRTVSANLIHSMLAMHGHSIKIRELIGNQTSQKRLLELLPGSFRLILLDLIAQIELFEKQIDGAELLLEQLMPESDPKMQLIMSAPGFGLVCSRIILSEIFDIAYFKAPKSLVNYSGLAPVKQTSDGKKKAIVKLNRHINYYLKYAFSTAAHAARRHPRFKRKYEQDVKKHGKIQAKINLARRLAKAIYWMLSRHEPFKF